WGLMGVQPVGTFVAGDGLGREETALSGTTDAAWFEETLRSLLAKAGLVAGAVGAGTLAWRDAAEAATITGWVDVKDQTYGATGDGSTNDRNAIQNALNDAAERVCY